MLQDFLRKRVRVHERRSTSINRTTFKPTFTLSQLQKIVAVSKLHYPDYQNLNKGILKPLIRKDFEFIWLQKMNVPEVEIAIYYNMLPSSVVKRFAAIQEKMDSLSTEYINKRFKRISF